ncbi:hypothetical protein UlMin_020576 [Ulmus minor]
MATSPTQSEAPDQTLTPQNPNPPQEEAHREDRPSGSQPSKTLTLEIPDNQSSDHNQTPHQPGDRQSPFEIDQNQDDPEEENEANQATASVTSTTIASIFGSVNRRGTKRKKGQKRRAVAHEKKARQKLEVLEVNLKPIPFVPAKHLDFSGHEKLLKRLGLWDFVHIEFDREIRADLLAQLIATFDHGQRGSYVNGVRIKVNRADLARALKLPVRKTALDGTEEVPVTDESIEFIENFVSNWVLLHDDTWMMPNEVLNCTKAIKEKNLEKVDWPGVIWFMVEQELMLAPQLTNCYYASHLQCLIKSQRENLFSKDDEHRNEIDVKDDDDEEEEDARMGGDDGLQGHELEEHNIKLSLGQDNSVEKADAGKDNMVEQAQAGVDSIIEKVDVTGENIVDKTVAGQDDRVDKPDAGKDDIVENVDARHEEIIEKAGVGHEEIVEKADAEHEEIVEKADAGHEEIVEKADAGHEKIVEKADAMQDDIVEKVDAGQEDVVEKFDAGQEDIVENADAGQHDVVENADAGQHDDVENADARQDDIVVTADAEQKQAGVVDLMDFEGCKEEEPAQWLLHGKNSENEPFLRQCNFDEQKHLGSEERKQEIEEGSLGGEEEVEAEEIEDDEDEDEDEDEQEEQHGGFHLSPKGLEGLASGSLIHSLDADQMTLNSGMQLRDPLAGEFLSSRDDMRMSIFGNGNKREIRNENDSSQYSHGGNKRMRIDGHWDNNSKPSSEFDMCMEQMQQWMGKARMMYSTKEQACEEATMHQQFLLNEIQQRDTMIEQLHKAKFEEHQKKLRCEQELYVMENLLDGYRKALKETRREFAHYRARCPQLDEPLYKDVAGGGGLVLSTMELEKRRIKQEEEERMQRMLIERKVKEFETWWQNKFKASLFRVDFLADKLLHVEEDLKLLKESFAKCRVPETSEPPLQKETPETHLEESKPSLENETPEPQMEETSEPPMEGTSKPPLEKVESEPLMEKETSEKEASELPLEKETSELPLEKETSELPLEKETPELPLEKETPELPLEKETPVLSLEKETTECPLEKETPELPLEKETPVLPLEKETPECLLEKETPELRLEKETPELPMEKETPELRLEKETPELPMEKETPECPLEKETPDLRLEKETPELPPEKETPEPVNATDS